MLLLLLLPPAGLLKLVGNEDELAAVLAHEVRGLGNGCCCCCCSS
jgi:hypothetical protein